MQFFSLFHSSESNDFEFFYQNTKNLAENTFLKKKTGDHI